MNPQQMSAKPTNPAPWVIFAVVVLAVAGGMWYVSGQGDGNANTVGLTNRANTDSSNTNVGTVDMEGWKTYEIRGYSVAFRHPSDWAVRNERLQEGTFQDDLIEGMIDQFIIDPPSSSLDFPAAGQCSVSIFPESSTQSLAQWIENNSLYGEEGSLTLMEKQAKRVNDINGILVKEGGENSQMTYSFYFLVAGSVARFGYYDGVDVAPYEVFKQRSQTCQTIMSSLTKL